MQANTTQFSLNRSIVDTSSTTSKSKQTFKKMEKQVKFTVEAKICPSPSPYTTPTLRRDEIWWQVKEINEFRKAARIITKTSLTCKNRTWLSQSNSEQNKENQSHHKEKLSDDEDVSKWWCRYGHSRRGLEHLCNIEEGKSRQKNAKVATQAVIEEQELQRMAGEIDNTQIASVSRLHTSWARDLAYAAALADQEAVLNGFSPLIKSRNDYVLQSLMSRQRSSRSFNKMQAADVIGINPSQRNYSNFRTVCRKRPCRSHVDQQTCDDMNNDQAPLTVKKATIISV